MFRFGVSQFTTLPWSFEQDVENYGRLGIDAIEICEEKLDKDRAAEQLALVEQSELEVCSVQPEIRTLFPSRMQPEPEEISERLSRFRGAIEFVSPYAPGAPFICNTGPSPDGNIQKVFEVAAQEYADLADFARERGARVALEPLSPAIMNVESAIWTLGQAVKIVEAVNRENFGICLDIWNIWQNANVVEEIKACGERIFAVHVSDWRTPRSFEDRHIVGHGEIPLPPLLNALHESGYRGAYTLEIFSRGVPDPLWEADLEEVISESRAGLEKAWKESPGSTA